MQYLALLISTERDHTDEQGDLLNAYQDFHAKAGSAIRAGDALLPAATAVRISGGPDAPTITDGPFVEAAEVAGGYYVFEAENLDDALELASGVPAARYGAIEVRPIYHTVNPEWSRSGGQIGWHCCWSRPQMPMSRVHRSGRRKRRGTVNSLLSRAITLSAGPQLHQPATATTVRVRNGEVLLTDGPFAEAARSPPASTCCPQQTGTRRSNWPRCGIPASAVELRQLAGVSGL